MVNKLDSIIELSPGFNTAVDIENDLENEKKIAAYIPTEIASDILLDMGENLHVLRNRRSRLLTGTYGTGKSHLALVLAKLYKNGTNADYLAPIFKKLHTYWPGKAKNLENERNELQGKFLLVLLNGDKWGAFDDSLLHYLDIALQKEGLDDLLPETAFNAALKRISELRDNYENEYDRLKKIVRDFGFDSVKSLEGQLQDKKRSTYDKFCVIHETLFAGAKFYRNHLMTPADVYTAVSMKLRSDKGYAGIIVIWDEFGRYMERVVDDPGGLEGQNIQDFAQKGCNASQLNQIHLYLICHRSLQEYVDISSMKRTTGMSKNDQDEWVKISGRFRQFNMKTTDHEVFQLINHIIIQKTDDPKWKSFVEDSKDYLDEWTDNAYRLKIFPEFNRNEIHRIVTQGAYPLHPITAFCLPRISERVAQNERTMFQFLSDSGSDTLGPYIHITPLPDSGESPPFFSADELWEFFYQDVVAHPIHRKIASKFNQADVLIDPDDILAKRIIRTLALLQIISSDRTPCTEEMIINCLGLLNSERPNLREKLKSLCSKEVNRDIVLVQSKNDGSYRFTGVGTVDFEAKIEQVVQDRMGTISAISHIRGIADELGLENEIPATEYSDDFMLIRALKQEIVDFNEIQKSDRWFRNLGTTEFRDGNALIVLCEDGQEINKAKQMLTNSFKHNQLMIAIPKEPVHIEVLLRKHEAIRYLEKEQGNLYGEGADLREEWEQQDQDYLDTIGNSIRNLIDPENRLLTWFINGEEIPNVGSRSRLRNAVSEMMRNVFPLTPKIAHERLTTESGRDNFIGARREIINKLLMRNGPELLARETSSQHKTVINFVYKKNGILREKHNKTIIGVPDSSAFLAMNKVWGEIEDFVQDAGKAQEALPMVDLITTLRRAPYGLRIRSISLIVAAVFRTYIQRGNLSFEYRESSSSLNIITKIDGKILDDAVLSADKYKLSFTDIGKRHEAILFGIASALSIDFSQDSDKGELIELIHKETIKWWRGLPLFSQKTRYLEANTLNLRERIIRPLAQDDADTKEILLFTAVDMIQPKKGEKTQIAQEAITDFFTIVIEDIEKAIQKILVPKIYTVIEDTFPEKGSSKKGPLKALRDWYIALPKERQEIRIGGPVVILINYARLFAQANKENMELILDLAKDITGMALENWGDDMIVQFGQKLGAAKIAIEETVISKPIDVNSDTITINKPKPKHISIVISNEKGSSQRTFIPVDEISSGGENLRNIIQGAIEGIGRTLPPNECETILIEIIREMLK